MQPTELLVHDIIAGRLRRAEEERLARLAVRHAGQRREPCPPAGRPECVPALQPLDRTA